MASRTRAEQETILRWDAEDPRIDMYTASPVVAARWTRLGYTLTPLGPASYPTGWRCLAPAGSVTVRRVRTSPRQPRKLSGFLDPTRRQPTT